MLLNLINCIYAMHSFKSKNSLVWVQDNVYYHSLYHSIMGSQACGTNNLGHTRFHNDTIAILFCDSLCNLTACSVAVYSESCFVSAEIYIRMDSTPRFVM